MKLLLLTPPLLQCNAPYAATPLLTASLRARGHEVVQADASLETLLRLFSRHGLERMHRELSARKRLDSTGRLFLDQFDRYVAVIEPVIAFLQGRDNALAHRIVGGELLPQGPRFAVMVEQETDEQGSLAWAFGEMGVVDQARYMAGLMLDDLARVVREEIDADFGFSRYGERLSVSLPSFDPLHARLCAPPTLVDRIIEEIAVELVERHAPDLVGFTVPFPGTLYGALRMAGAMRRTARPPRIALGGGYIATELREPAEPRVFDWADYICLDEGIEPLEAIVAGGDIPPRTFVRRGTEVVRGPESQTPPPPHAQLSPPTYDGLVLDRYFPVVEMLNSMHALWNGGYWNRLMLVHGCYWHGCRFCDTSLDYIRRYDRAPASRQVDWIEQVVAQTGRRGFHFVDEALPPAVLRGVSEELLRRGTVVSWWGNIRFEKGITDSLADLMARAGCIAVTGGLEALDDRLLRLMNKGYTVAEATRACAALARKGIMVHAYLMYGLPTQSVQETVDCLERVRRLFAAGFIHSAFWHRFAATVHSDIGMHPENYGIETTTLPSTFARNEIPFTDHGGVDHESLGRGLHKAVYNYMHGVGLDADPRSWFDRPVPSPRVGPDEIVGRRR